MTEMVGYDGPIYMTYPTKAIVPVLLVRFPKIVRLKDVIKEDYRKVQTEFRGETNFFTSAMIKTCMKKVGTASAYRQTCFLLGDRGQLARSDSRQRRSDHSTVLRRARAGRRYVSRSLRIRVCSLHRCSYYALPLRYL